MSNVLSFRDPEIVFLDELVEDLTGIFHVIAHTDEGTEAYIRESQEYVRRQYELYLDVCRTYESYHVIRAYDILQELLEGNPTPTEIRTQCEDALYEHLMEGVEPEDLEDEDLAKWALEFENYFLKQ